DETDRIRVTLWGDATTAVESLSPGDDIEIMDGYVRERDDNIELHCNERSAIESVDESVEFTPNATAINDLEEEMTTDIAGVVRSTDPKRTFDRDDGSEGQVRNVRIQDETGDIRVALWGEKADLNLGPGDEVLFTDVEIQDGWQDDIEASAGWQSTAIQLADGTTAVTESTEEKQADAGTGLDAFTTDGSPSTEDTSGDDGEADEDAIEKMTFTGVVVQAGDPIILDNGNETITVSANIEAELGEEITVTGKVSDGNLITENVQK
ncbi:MAG: replication factor A, partial [Halobacteriaceae archaeon]